MVSAVAMPSYRECDVERFWSKVNKNGPIAEHMETPCWLWTDVPGNKGYGFFWLNPRKVLAHRFSYELTVGPVPEGQLLDHRCFVRICVNHDHLHPLTNQQNSANREHPGRGVSFDKKTGKWRAQAHYNGRTTYLGLFVDQADAERVAADARRERGQDHL